MTLAASDETLTATTSCPLCHSERHSVREVFGAYTVCQCQGCGLLLTLPVPSPEALRELYSRNYYGGSQAERFRLAPAEWLQQFFRWRRARLLARQLGVVAGRRILDVGCGRAYTLAWLARWGADVYGTQLSDAAAAVAKERIGSERVFVGELAEARFPNASFDCVTLWHVLEHVPDPVALLKEIARILKPRGMIYVEVPNAGGWSARTFGRHWLAYDVPKHLVHFTPATLEAAGRQTGLVCVKLLYGSLEYSPVTFLQSLLTAWLGGEHLLFRLASHEVPQDPFRRRAGTLRILFHCFSAALLALPALLWSKMLDWRKAGDTMGGYFQRRETAC